METLERGITVKSKAQIAHDKATTWYERWAEEYNATLSATYLNTSRLGNKTLAQFYGYFKPYEDIPNVTGRLKADKLQVTCNYDRHGALTDEQLCGADKIKCLVSRIDDCYRARLTDEHYNAKAIARLRKIERKLNEWRAKVDETESVSATLF